MNARTAARPLSRRQFLAGVTAASAAGVPPRRGWGGKKKLNVYNWGAYLGETTLEKFAEKTGISVQCDFYSSNDDLIAKLQSGNPGYDVIFPSGWAVNYMIKRNMLIPLDHSRLGNLDNIDPDFRDPAFDPGLGHSVPYMWGTMGIGYRTTSVDSVPDSWGALLDSDKYSGRIALLGDARSVIGAALKYLGHPMNSLDAQQVAEARDLLIAQKPHIKAFATVIGQDMLIAGDADLVMEWNGDVAKVMQEDDELNYVVPREGTTLWIDNVCVPAGAPHLENAYAFIDHILDARVNAEIADTICYATANRAARSYIDPANLANPVIYPSKAVRATAETVIEIDDPLRLYDKAWTAILAA